MSADSLASPVWPLWKSLHRLFPVWGWLTGLGTPGAWSQAGIDHVTGLRRNRSTDKAFALFADSPDAEFEAVAAIADLNARRQKQMFSVVAVAYVTIPLSLIGIGAEVFSSDVERFARANPGLIAQGVMIATAGALYYFASHWRARQIVEVMELIRLERLVTPKPTPPARRKTKTTAG